MNVKHRTLQSMKLENFQDNFRVWNFASEIYLALSSYKLSNPEFVRAHGLPDEHFVKFDLEQLAIS